jgi:hypothetical protein
MSWAKASVMRMKYTSFRRAVSRATAAAPTAPTSAATSNAGMAVSWNSFRK